MAFITGVDIEQRLASEQALAIPKKRPPRRQRNQLALEDGGWKVPGAFALKDAEKPVEYGQLLKQADALKGHDDPLEELRRRIKRTRGKMDAQNQVMDGFLNDVRVMQQIDRSFSSSEMGEPSSPAALTGGTEHKCLGSGTARPSSGSRPARALTLRSDGANDRQLVTSRSQPALMAAANGSLHNAAPLSLPNRRAPPGAPCTDFQKAVSTAAAARRAALASAGAVARSASASAITGYPGKIGNGSSRYR